MARQEVRMGGLVVAARQRRSLRRGVSVECQVVAEKSFELLGIRAVDLSPEGMLVRSRGDVELGEAMIVSFCTPIGRFWLDAEARVVRVVRGLRATDCGAHIALHFETMDRVSRALLTATLQGFPPPVPARRLRLDYASTVRGIARVDYASNVWRIAHEPVGAYASSVLQ